MKEIVEQGLLYDFYGELLTEHQKKIYEAAVYEDLSLAEIADENGISRQGVHDLIKRCTGTLKSYEDKLHMIRRFEDIKKRADELARLSGDESLDEESLREKIREIADGILEELG